MSNYIEIETAERTGASYEFDELKVVRSVETGILYYATDSGCSCPTPFEHEDANFPEAWTPIKKGESWRAFEAAFMNWADGGKALTLKDKTDFLDQIRAALKASEGE